MSGAKIQLINRGDLDVYLTGNPSITFFKSVYRKHTNFSMEDMIIGTISTPRTSGKYAVKIPGATGDLLYKTNLNLHGNRVFCGNGVANISTAVIDNIAFSIGSREIDRTYGHYLEVYHELNQENPNSTITNIARIEDSSLYHIGHNADLAALAVHKSMINNNHADTTYIENNLAKPTTIMGHGLGYPPTHFQKLSKCGGTYCSPSYMQKYKDIPQEAVDDYNEANHNYIASVNTRPTSSAHVSGMNRRRFTLQVMLLAHSEGDGAESGHFTYTLDQDVLTNSDYIMFNVGDNIKISSVAVMNENDGNWVTGGTFTVLKTVKSSNNDKITVYIEKLKDADSPPVLKTLEGAGETVQTEMIVTTKNWSSNLFNGGQLSDSGFKGDILGECILPLNFWYCRTPGLAIPLIALNKGVDVELYIQFATEDAADWSKSSDADAITDKYISYDTNVSCSNDVCNAYKIGKNNSDCKAILNDTESKFNFDMDISVGYIFLDNMERQRFKSSTHEYLIEQLQYHRHNSQDNTVNLSSFHHPVKELIWTGQPFLSNKIISVTNYDEPAYSNSKSHQLNLDDTVNHYAHSSGIRFVSGLAGGDKDSDILYGGGIINSEYSKGFGNKSFITTWGHGDKPIKTTTATVMAHTGDAGGTLNPWEINGKFVQGLLGPSTPDCLNYCSYKIVLNGNDRCQWKPLQHFTRENIHKYHKGGCISVPDSIAVYSFALDPTDINPTGTCNFSNIDSIHLERNQTQTQKDLKKLNVYAINYNILRFTNGQAGLAYVL